MDSSPAGFPVLHKKLTVDIKRIKTDLIICQYEDHYLVIVTQLGSMGTLLQAKKEEGVSVLPTFNVSVIFGKRDEPMLVACARQLIENIRPLYLCTPVAVIFSKGWISLILGSSLPASGEVSHTIGEVPNCSRGNIVAGLSTFLRILA